MRAKPVRPSRPTLSPAFSEKETSCRTAGKSGAYLTTKFSTIISESFGVFEGQYAGTLLESMMVGGSWGKFRLQAMIMAKNCETIYDLLLRHTFY
jgi:hypothetical protein